jgi:hypothetical protein
VWTDYFVYGRERYVCVCVGGGGWCKQGNGRSSSIKGGHLFESRTLLLRLGSYIFYFPVNLSFIGIDFRNVNPLHISHRNICKKITRHRYVQIQGVLLPFVHICNHRLKCNTYFRLSCI